MVARLASMPAVRPASALDPITRNVKPERAAPHEPRRAGRRRPSATIRPKLTRSPDPNRCGSVAEDGMVCEIELLCPGCCSGFVVSR